MFSWADRSSRRTFLPPPPSSSSYMGKIYLHYRLFIPLFFVHFGRAEIYSGFLLISFFFAFCKQHTNTSELIFCQCSFTLFYAFCTRGYFTIFFVGFSFQLLCVYTTNLYFCPHKERYKFFQNSNPSVSRLLRFCCCLCLVSFIQHFHHQT